MLPRTFFLTKCMYSAVDSDANLKRKQVFLFSFALHCYHNEVTSKLIMQFLSIDLSLQSLLSQCDIFYHVTTNSSNTFTFSCMITCSMLVCYYLPMQEKKLFPFRALIVPYNFRSYKLVSCSAVNLLTG